MAGRHRITFVTLLLPTCSIMEPTFGTFKNFSATPLWLPQIGMPKSYLCQFRGPTRHLIRGANPFMRTREPRESSDQMSVRDELFLQPWFVSKPTYLAIRRLLPSSQMLKMRYYFEDYGCLRCQSRNSIYASNGMCKQCSIIVRSRIVLSLKRRFRKLGVAVARTPIKQYLERLKR